MRHLPVSVRLLTAILALATLAAAADALAKDRRGGNRGNGGGGGSQLQGNGNQGKSFKGNNQSGGATQGGNTGGARQFNSGPANSNRIGGSQFKQNGQPSGQANGQLNNNLLNKDLGGASDRLKGGSGIGDANNNSIGTIRKNSPTLKRGVISNNPVGGQLNNLGSGGGGQPLKLDIHKPILGKDPKLIGGELNGKATAGGRDGAPQLGISGVGTHEHHKQAAKLHAQHLFDALHDHDNDHWHGKKFNWSWNDYNTLHYHHHHGYWFGGVWYAPLLITRAPTVVYLPVAEPTPSGHRWLGVTFEPYAGGGVFVTGVYEGSPAQQAGISPGDVILTLDEFDATDLRSAVQASIDPVTTIVVDGRSGEVLQKELFLAVP